MTLSSRSNNLNRSLKRDESISSKPQDKAPSNTVSIVSKDGLVLCNKNEQLVFAPFHPSSTVCQHRQEFLIVTQVFKQKNVALFEILVSPLENRECAEEYAVSLRCAQNGKYLHSDQSYG